MEVSYQYEDIAISGVIGKPEIARSNRSNQLFFVNKRYIKDKTLTAATEQAYKGLIPIGKFGFVVLNLEMNPAKVDVNVHPAKLEVRFQEENKVFQSIYHAIKDTLLKGELVANTDKGNAKSENTIERTPLSFEERLKNIREAKRESESGGLFAFRKQNEKQIEKYTEEESKIKTNILEDIYENKKTENQTEEIPKALQQQTNAVEKIGNPIDTSDVLEQLKQMKTKMENELEKETIKTDGVKDTETEYNLEKDDKEEFNQIKQKMEELNNNPQVVSQDFNEMYTKLFGTAPIMEQEEEEKKDNAVDIIKDNISVFETQEEFQKPAYKFIGIVFKTYIILEIDKEMYILDQHAAHERIMYEKVKKNYYSEKTKDSQMLLLPDVITLTHKEMDIAKENISMFEQAGFSLEEFGENTIKLTGVPTVCVDLDTKELFLETLDEINTVARTAKQEKEEKFIATVACKAAVKANMALTIEEVEKLMDQLLKLPNPFTCPHGRPTAIKMTKYDIERKFARK